LDRILIANEDMISLVQERKELFALAAWIQTFPEFKTSLSNSSDVDDNYERLLSSLDSYEAASYVSTMSPHFSVGNSKYFRSHEFLTIYTEMYQK
jgi:hypothetical protein